ncbi:hypothetical protein TUBRATIS_007440 [Tubulinosema ratisbonensis]|uniref:Rab-GAP TBC domain-containing protein n=1 Tax=Tubulinosema ratisbonensis TaxID=291195 RepID=A0A437ANF0_9MICR|nr:hypothetical protein TUBRATIS_007440 [Tubulinosema ratisbonensis]
MGYSDDLKKSFYIINHKLTNSYTKLHRLISRQVDPNDPTPLNKFELQNYAYYGFDDKFLRPKIWKIFLFYYSDNKFKNELFYKERRKSYKEFKLQSIRNKEINVYIDDIIHEDVNRTFLFPNADRTFCSFLDSKFVNDDKCLTHREIIKEILLVFKTTNPGVDYVQGMNVLVTLIYYVFANSDEYAHVESDTFFCFLNLISEIGDYFLEIMDDKYVGISQKLTRVIDIVKEFDPTLYNNMKSKKLTENLFHFRWILLSFAQEYPIDEVVWLWDRFLADSTRFELVLYCAAAKIILLKNKILKNEFSTCMEILQNNNEVDVKSMFYKADEMRRKMYGGNSD